MKLTNLKLPRLFRSRKSRELEELLQASLVSSFVLSETLKNGSSSSDPQSRLCVMKFNEEWRHPDCAVMKWYELQTCKQFKSIQHWRNLDTQFQHEFLILILTDGSACCVERMGEGSRADAIRWIGCAAFDLIQWFAPKDHAAKRWSRGSSELIIEVEFPSPFDLLDVLAVCYTIQHKSPPASVYTLQRFNCYFLCNTILAVLTRRVAAWETWITDDDWPALIDDMIDDLNRRFLLPPEQQGHIDFFALGLCSLVNPDSANPAGFLLGPLRSDLEEGGRSSVNEGLAKVLWCEDIDIGVDEGLAMCYSKVWNTMPDGSSIDPATSRLHSLLDGADLECFPPTELDSSIPNPIPEEILAQFLSVVKSSFPILKRAHKMRELEIQSPLRLRLTASFLELHVSLGSGQLAYDLAKAPQIGPQPDTSFDERLVTTKQILSATPLRIRRTMQMRSTLRYLMFEGYTYKQEVLDDMMFAVIDESVESLFRLMLKILRPDSGPLRVPATLAFLTTCFPKACWAWCFQVCMARLSQDNYHSLFAQKAETLPTHSVQIRGTSMLASESTVADFQRHIKERICQHGKRVNSVGLGFRDVVQQDIEWSMTQVWESLPPGFGARRIERVSSICG